MRRFATCHRSSLYIREIERFLQQAGDELRQRRVELHMKLGVNVHPDG